MNRRKFIQVIGVGGTAFMFSGSVAACRGDGAAEALEAWDPMGRAVASTDPRMNVIAHAILAPNPHNTQAWKIRLVGDNQMLLYIDATRLLPMTDPLHRQIYIGQGTFLELAQIAAQALGHNCAIELLPDGTDDVAHTGQSPIARITLTPGATQIDELHEYIPRRVTNRMPFQSTPVETAKLDAMSGLSTAISIRFITDSTLCTRLADLVTEAMRVETYLDRTHRETVDMLRFSDSEILERRDGFGYANLGVTGISRFFAEKFAGRSAAMSESFRSKTIESIRKMADTAQTYGIMITSANDRTAQIETGRCYARLHLTATKLGLALHPMSQILQEYEELDGVREQFLDLVGRSEGTIQMLFRLGYADEAPHSPRRRLNDFIGT